MQDKPEILLIGGGGHCRSVIDVIELEGKFAITGIIDKKELIGESVLGYKIIGCDDDLTKFVDIYKYAVITVGQIRSNSVRIKLFTSLQELGYTLPAIISPLAYVSKHSDVDEGTVIMHHALVNANVSIGKNCIINTKSLIEHDSVVENYCHISTGAIINGGTLVKENIFIGSNSVSKESITISSFVKAGSLVK